MQRKKVTNKIGLLASVVALWLQCFVEGDVHVKCMRMLFGKLDWEL